MVSPAVEGAGEDAEGGPVVEAVKFLRIGTS